MNDYLHFETQGEGETQGDIFWNGRIISVNLCDLCASVVVFTTEKRSTQEITAWFRTAEKKNGHEVHKGSRRTQKAMEYISE